MSNPPESASDRVLDAAIVTALETLLPDHGEARPVDCRPFLARVRAGEHEVRARRWPAGTIPQRIRFVHGVLAGLARTEPGLAAQAFTGTGNRTWIAVGDALIDLQTWLPGVPAGGRSTPQLPDGHALHRPGEVGGASAAMLVKRIAALHAGADSVARARHVPVAPVGHILETVQRRWKDWRVRLRPAAPNYPPIQRWIRLGEQILPAAEETLHGGELDTQPPVVAHLDLWPAHILIDGETIRLLDFGSAAVTTPLLDLAQTVTRFQGWSGERAEAALSDYAEVRSLAPDERRLLPAVAALDLILEAARLLHYGYTGAVPYSSREASAARRGALDLLNSLEAVQPAVVRSSPFVAHARQRQLARIATGKAKSSGPRKPGGKPFKKPTPPA